MLQATLYLRIPVELRDRIDRATMARHNGLVKRGDMRQLVIDALTVGLDELVPERPAPAPAPAPEVKSPAGKRPRKLRPSQLWRSKGKRS